MIIENVLEGDEVRTNLNEIERLLKEMESSSILCIFSTLSCFAPRTPDKYSDVSFFYF